MTDEGSTVGRRRRARGLARILAAAATGSATLLAPAARAQQTTFYLDRAQFSGAPDDGAVVFRPYLSDKTRYYANATLGYTLHPLRNSNVTDNTALQQLIENPVDNQLIMHLAVGAEFFGRFGLELALPITVFQNGGRDPSEASDGTATGIGGGLQRTPFVMDDLRLSAKVRVYQSDDRKLQLGVGGAVFVPTGNATAFGGDNQATGYLWGSGEYNFGAFTLAGTLGPHFRPNSGIDDGNKGGLDVGSELRWAGGVFFPLRRGDVRLGASLWGTTGIVQGATTDRSTFFSTNNTDLEWLGEIRFRLSKQPETSTVQPFNWYFNGGLGTRLTAGYGAPDVRMFASIGTWSSLLDFGPGQAAPRRQPPDVEMHDKDTDGDGYPDDIDECPTEKEDGKPPNPTDGCPAPKDRDGDGIPDDVDKCPDQPEDKDGIMDDDGCPETDADNDGIPDTEDACPLIPGVPNKDPKKNGCKEEHKKIIETTNGLQLLEPIQFDTGKSTIKEASFSVLDEVVDVLNSRPDIRMGVYGNTDSHGSHAMNTQLSKSRARAVVAYLVQKGIAKSRLESDGFGPDKPVDTNDTEEGRAKNRRVDFKILEK